MKIFLSWSGPISHAIAEKLYKWLPMVIQRVEPYISTEIEKGSRWGSDIAAELEKCAFGIACVTNDNKEAPWLLFEAGALSKSVSEGKVAPILFGLDQSDIQRSPLTQFQMTKFERDEFLKLLQTINESLESGLEPSTLNSLFDVLWLGLETDIAGILASASVSGPINQNVDPVKILGAMEELLANSRAISQAISRPERLLPEDYLDFVFRKHARETTLSSTELRRLDATVRHALRTALDIREVTGEELRPQVEHLIASLEEIRYLARGLHLRGARDRAVTIGRPISLVKDEEKKGVHEDLTRDKGD